MDKKVVSLDGLRGIGAFIVMFSHLRYAFYADADSVLFSYLRDHTHPVIAYILFSFYSLITDGNFAVYVFWFISGYVISIKLFTTNTNDYLLAAASKRYFRLAIPALGSVMIAYLVMSLNLMFCQAQATHLGHGYADGWLSRQYNFEPSLTGAFKSGAWDTFFDFRQFPNYNTSLWTMSPELYGSLFCFFLFGIYRLHKYRHWIYIIMIIGTSYLPAFWLTTFIAGMFLCDIDHTENLLSPFLEKSSKFLTTHSVAAVIFVLVVIVFNGITNLEVHNQNLHGFSQVILASFTVFLIMRSGVKNLFATSLLQWTGKISFSLYLLHVIVLCSLGSFLYLFTTGDHHNKAVVAVGATIVGSILLAQIYTGYVDKFAIKFSNRLGSFIVKTKK